MSHFGVQKSFSCVRKSYSCVRKSHSCVQSKLKSRCGSKGFLMRRFPNRLSIDNQLIIKPHSPHALQRGLAVVACNKKAGYGNRQQEYMEGSIGSYPYRTPRSEGGMKRGNKGRGTEGEAGL